MQVIVYEDELVAQLAPVTLSRPAYTICCASFRLIELVKPLGTVRCVARELQYYARNRRRRTGWVRSGRIFATRFACC